MNTVQRRSTLFLILALLLVQCSAVTLPQPGETFSDLLSSGEPGPEMVVIAAGEFLMGCFGSPPPLPGVDCHPREEPDAGQRPGVGAGLLEPQLCRRSVGQRGVDRRKLRATCHARR